MSARTIDNPGVELNEIDRSNYEKIDNSLPNSPTSFIIGYADKGPDMTLEWIDSKSTFEDTFGSPTTEFESYMYNAAIEVLNRGGSCIASKLPYDNNSYDGNSNPKYNYVDFDTSQFKFNGSIEHHLCASTEYTKIDDIKSSLLSVLQQLGETGASVNAIKDMSGIIAGLHSKYFGVSPFINQINDLSSELVKFINEYVVNDYVFSLMYYNDNDLTSYIDIKYRNSSSSSLDELDNYITHRAGSLPSNTIRIYDMTRSQYGTIDNCQCVSSTAASAYTNECLGIVPVIVTPVNALYFQNLLDAQSYSMIASNSIAYNSVSAFATMPHEGIVQNFEGISSFTSLQIASIDSFSGSFNAYDIDSLSRQAAMQFPLINFYDQDHFDKTNLKKIGVVVFKAFRDTSNQGKIGFQLLESFVGSLEKNSRDSITKSSAFIEDIVNQSSRFIHLFSNVDQKKLQQATTVATSLQTAMSLGFYKQDCAKNISYYNSVMNPLNTILDKAANPNIVPIDLIVDAGMSNIGCLARSQSMLSTDLMPNVGDYDEFIPDDFNLLDISGWRAVVNRFNSFCKTIRKDCMFIADGLRSICLQGNSKIVRPTAPENTVAKTIIPKFRRIAHTIDSSYAAGYCNWFLAVDYSRENSYIWIPPSIKAMGVYIYCDTYFHPWSAPAGTTRGIIGDAVDVAFLPTDADAGIIYSNSWNYAMSYPIDGIVIEGHKTFQSQKTALDRVNVRRLMLDLEKKVANVARNFVYEQNTPYMRQQFVDNIEPILDDAKSGLGISDYAIKCDDELNTTQVIENNEMRCKIAVKPVKVVDWIVLDFICVNQSANVNEEILR